MTVAKEEPKDQAGKRPQKFEFEIGHHHHDPGKFSLKITAENHHIDLTTYSWTHKPGYQATWTIYDLTPDDVMALGTAILETSFRMKQGQEGAKAPPKHVDPEL